MNITERFFRAIWNKREIEIDTGFQKIKRNAYICPQDEFQVEYLPENLPYITQSWPDFKKYVIPVMRERGLKPSIYDWGEGQGSEAGWKLVKGPYSILWKYESEVSIEDDEILTAWVEAAVQVLERENGE